MSSCSSTKFVPKGEYWLENVSITSDTKDITPMDMETYLAQKANYKTFAIFRLPLFIYNLSGRDSTKWINKILRSGGEPPVIFDSTLVYKSADNLTQVLKNKGYVHAKVTDEVFIKNNRVKIKYNIEAGEPYKIKEYEVNIPDSLFNNNKPFGILHNDPRFRADSTILNLNRILKWNTLVKSQAKFDLNVLDDERARISSLFRRFGYYDFNREYIGFVADTITGGKDKVNLELTIYPFTQRAESGNITEMQHQQYIVKEVDFYVDYNPLTDGYLTDYRPTETVERNDGKFKIYYGIRGKYIKPHIILDNNFISPDALYNENATSQTYNSLARLHILKNINIKYELLNENDSTKLKCIITCIPDKKQGISTEIEGTNSGGRFGVGSSIGYLHRNIFKGSELFNVKLQGGYEAISFDFSNFAKNYFEIGAETSVTFPRFMFPFLQKDLRRRLNASTQFTANYTYQRRPDYFSRTILSSGVKYLWNNRRNSSVKHTFDLVEVSYVRIPELSKDFIEKLTPAARIYSFTDQFILSTGYTYSNTNYNPSRRTLQPVYSFRGQVETAGNLLSLIGNLANSPKDEIGSRTIFGTRFAQYARLNIDYSQTIPIDEKNAIAWRIGGGLAFPYGNNKEVPIQKRFFSGGANSVRGWGVRELGPGSFGDTINNFYNHSGDIRFDANIEYRSKVFWKFELASFIDAGNIWTVKKYKNQENGEFKLDRAYKEIAASWGIGLRLDLEYVLIRLDWGWKIYDPTKNPIYKMEDGEKVLDHYETNRWPTFNSPLSLGRNTAWHIAVGYPF
ncbi:BamA/TamA family outer membrane protein [Dysgonomonas sp. 216]|uniref:translocation and assembly module lipoprotein TamL n=1 Tax=Dysgonomonas sp. 216 TaxID=2302934 RepID=UPI002101E093|nr:BamA/TamA family outer membrane protein [Dysgonomonas sp. 216]